VIVVGGWIGCGGEVVRLLWSCGEVCLGWYGGLFVRGYLLLLYMFNVAYRSVI
jgi:hypothetical protein